MTKRAPSVMGGGATVGTVAARMRSAQSRTLWPGAQPSAAAVRLTWLMMPCASMWSPSPMWHVRASAVAAARSIRSRKSRPTIPALSLPMPASFMITARTGHLAALKAL